MIFDDFVIQAEKLHSLLSSNEELFKQYYLIEDNFIKKINNISKTRGANQNSVYIDLINSFIKDIKSIYKYDKSAYLFQTKLDEFIVEFKNTPFIEINELNCSFESLLEKKSYFLSSSWSFTEKNCNDLFDYYNSLKLTQSIYQGLMAQCKLILDMGNKLKLLPLNNSDENCFVVKLRYEDENIDFSYISKNTNLIGNIISTINSVMSNKEEREDIKLQRLETGSLFQQLTGHKDLIELLKQLFTFAYSTYYRMKNEKEDFTHKSNMNKLFEAEKIMQLLKDNGFNEEQRELLLRNAFEFAETCRKLNFNGDKYELKDIFLLEEKNTDLAQ